MNGSRRWFLKSSAAFGTATLGLKRAVASPSAKLRRIAGDLGPLRPDPDGVVDLPEGFSYEVFSIRGETMDDGFLVPAGHDGMAAFPGEDGKTVLVRNHEMLLGRGGPFGDDGALLERVDPAKLFDPGYGNTPAIGGTTTLVYDTAKKRLEHHFLSLAGTARNCCGGPTPWGSWVTCEEYPGKASDAHEQDHGWCFEVPSSADGLVDPVPLTDMGRFNHEAIAVDAASGVVYQTEDTPDGLLYRFIPREKGNLAQGGKLEALMVEGAPGLDTRNWGGASEVPEDAPMEVRWIELDEVEAPEDDLRKRGSQAGAARFARGEGMWAGAGEIFFACTSGGPARAGQVWRYVPSPHEGTRSERDEPGTLTLFAQSPDRGTIDMCDNLTITPWGDLILCEDGPGENNLVGVTRAGDVYPLARNAMVDDQGRASEFAGACFSPGGSTLFCNIQGAGITLAITGPWPSS
jgi:secreted PhoX family phosphatase